MTGKLSKFTEAITFFFFSFFKFGDFCYRDHNFIVEYLGSKSQGDRGMELKPTNKASDFHQSDYKLITDKD